MRKNKSQTPVTTIGVSSLLVVFLILCLVTFACLSLSTAKSDYSFSQANAAHKTAYYEACNRAEEFLHDMQEDKEKPVTTWRTDIDKKQALEVSIRPSGGSYEITGWKTVPTVEHNYNQNMTLMK